MIGRSKLDGTKLENKAADSHVASTDQERFGKIFRRNMPFGTVSEHGTMFVGFSADQHRLASMLQSMVGLIDGTRDAVSRYTRPVSGAYYFVPSTEALRRRRREFGPRLRASSRKSIVRPRGRGLSSA